MTSFSQNYLDELSRLLQTFPHEQFDRLIAALFEARDRGSRIFTMGNGGSATTASHWACDMNKGCSPSSGKRFRMLCLNDNIATMLAYANDLSYDDVFVEQLKNFFEPGDVVIGISGSGNSINVLRAIQYAAANHGTTVGLCGYGGGKLVDLVDIPLLARIDDMQKVEDIHMIVVHMVMQRISGELGCRC